MRILRTRSRFRGPLKWVMFLPLGVAALFTSVVVQTLSPPTGFSVYRHWPTLVVTVTAMLFSRAVDSGQLPGFRPRAHTPVDPLKGERRWTTARSMRTVYLTAAFVTALFIGVIAVKYPAIVAERYEAGILILGVATNVLFVIMIVLIIMAFRKPAPW